MEVEEQRTDVEPNGTAEAGGDSESDGDSGSEDEEEKDDSRPIVHSESCLASTISR